ncbi:MAG: hypothetical protein GY811_03260 [Myxococcales bacterium]|nr:hypothetical protein [Myxococcales bacterium]
MSKESNSLPPELAESAVLCDKVEPLPNGMAKLRARLDAEGSKSNRWFQLALVGSVGVAAVAILVLLGGNPESKPRVSELSFREGGFVDRQAIHLGLAEAPPPEESHIDVDTGSPDILFRWIQTSPRRPGRNILDPSGPASALAKNTIAYLSP